jgi:PAS domain S-box-containing protein
MRDSSLKVRLLERLRANSDLFRLFDSLADVCFFAKDRRGRFLMGNRAFLEKLGLDREEDLIGRDDFDFFPPRLVEIFLRDDQRVMQTREPLIDRVELVSNSDGSIDWHITSKVPLVSRNGCALGIAGVTRDFRKSGEHWRPHQQFAAVIEHINQHYSSPIQVEELASLMFWWYPQMTGVFGWGWSMLMADANGLSDQGLAGQEQDYATHRRLLLPEYRVSGSRDSRPGKSEIRGMERAQEGHPHDPVSYVPRAFLGADGHGVGGLQTALGQDAGGAGPYPGRMRNALHGAAGGRRQEHGHAVPSPGGRTGTEVA